MVIISTYFKTLLSIPSIYSCHFFFMTVRQANIHVLANSHLKQGIWALNPGEDRCSISRTVLSTISIVRSDVTIFFPLKFSQLRPLTTFCETGHVSNAKWNRNITDTSSWIFINDPVLFSDTVYIRLWGGNIREQIWYTVSLNRG
jgi:hypothetical protein